MIDKAQAKQSLLALQAEYNQRLNEINDHIRHPQDDDASNDWDDQALVASHNEIRMTLSQEAVENLALVNHALMKIDSEEFGHCETCGEEIEPKRLEAVPYAKMCIKHAH
ncbi:MULTISPECIES: TraR/DksA family transcriptional regulator [unclassified Acinetobacter]|uniref:TraR/DksA family transcriptional regulator n=1 Tax=unclassified Acinetobacter TaxID=196816 RepID=UPI0035B72070